MDSKVGEESLLSLWKAQASKGSLKCKRIRKLLKEWTSKTFLGPTYIAPTIVWLDSTGS